MAKEHTSHSHHPTKKPQTIPQDQQVPLKDTPETNPDPKPMVPAGSPLANNPPPNLHAGPQSSVPASNNPAGSETGGYNPTSGTGNSEGAAKPKDEDGKVKSDDEDSEDDE